MTFYDNLRLFLHRHFKGLHDFLYGVIETYRRYCWSDEYCIKRHFKKTMGYPLNLENPKTLNEKIQWLKLNDKSPLHTQCSDKYAVKEYIKETVGDQYNIPVLYTTTNTNDISMDKLPDYPIVIKTNHDNGDAVIIRDKKKHNFLEIQKLLNRKLARNYFYRNREWPYKNIAPLILVEKLLLDQKGNLPMDYKVHCFHGEAKMITVDIDRFGKHSQNFYDKNWNMLDCDWYFPLGNGVPKPSLLKELVRCAEELSKPFKYVRVDCYLVDKQVYVGEITFYQGGGLEAFRKPEWDRKLGDYIHI